MDKGFAGCVVLSVREFAGVHMAEPLLWIGGGCPHSTRYTPPPLFIYSDSKYITNRKKRKMYMDTPRGYAILEFATEFVELNLLDS